MNMYTIVEVPMIWQMYFHEPFWHVEDGHFHMRGTYVFVDYNM